MGMKEQMEKLKRLRIKLSRQKRMEERLSPIREILQQVREQAYNTEIILCSLNRSQIKMYMSLDILKLEGLIRELRQREKDLGKRVKPIQYKSITKEQ